jgi:hypothetical protein
MAFSIVLGKIFFWKIFEFSLDKIACIWYNEKSRRRIPQRRAQKVK